jgi:hypothetical protein
VIVVVVGAVVVGVVVKLIKIPHGVVGDVGVGLVVVVAA